MIVWDKHFGVSRIKYAAITDESKREIASASIAWAVNHEADEFASLETNTALLERLAAATGGEVIEADDLERFVRTLPARGAPIMTTELRPLWHVPLVLLLALTCFLSEWGIRRWKGLA